MKDIGLHVWIQKINASSPPADNTLHGLKNSSCDHFAVRFSESNLINHIGGKSVNVKTRCELPEVDCWDFLYKAICKLSHCGLDGVTDGLLFNCLVKLRTSNIAHSEGVSGPCLHVCKGISSLCKDNVVVSRCDKKTFRSCVELS